MTDDSSRDIRRPVSNVQSGIPQCSSIVKSLGDNQDRTCNVCGDPLDGSIASCFSTFVPTIASTHFRTRRDGATKMVGCQQRVESSSVATRRRGSVFGIGLLSRDSIFGNGRRGYHARKDRRTGDRRLRACCNRDARLENESTFTFNSGGASR